MIALAPFAMIVSSLELVEGHDDHLQLGHENARWLEKRSGRLSSGRCLSSKRMANGRAFAPEERRRTDSGVVCAGVGPSRAGLLGQSKQASVSARGIKDWRDRLQNPGRTGVCSV